MADPHRIIEQIGVFGSSFNPPHLAHLKVIETARRQFGLGRVIIVPTGDPYHKESGQDPGGSVRLRLAEAAFAGLAGVEVSATEVGRDGPSYTCDTLEEIADRNPDTEIHLLTGADAAKDIGEWHRPQRILELARVAVAPRAGTSRQEVESAFAAMDAGGRVEFIEMPEVLLSSTGIRSRLSAGEPVGGMLPAKVAEMIENEDIYGNE